MFRFCNFHIDFLEKIGVGIFMVLFATFIASLSYNPSRVSYFIRNVLHFLSISYLSLVLMVPLEIWSLGGIVLSLSGFGILWSLKPIFALEEREDEFEHPSTQHAKIFFCIFSFFMLITILLLGMCMSGAMVISMPQKIFRIVFALMLMVCSVSWAEKGYGLLNRFQKNAAQGIFEESYAPILFCQKEHYLGLLIIVTAILGLITFVVVCVQCGYLGYDEYVNNIHIYRMYLYTLCGLLPIMVVFSVFKKNMKNLYEHPTLKKFYTIVLCGLVWVGGLCILPENEMTSSCSVSENTDTELTTDDDLETEFIENKEIDTPTNGGPFHA